MNKRQKEKVWKVIQGWCDFHLDAGVSRWHKPPDDQYGFVYAGDGIQAALKHAGFKIVPA